jgi:AraC-like DNA-binding protein
MQRPDSWVDAATIWDIAAPSCVDLDGVAMAGFRSRGLGRVDLQAVPYPAVTLGFDLSEGLVVEGPRGVEQGSVAVGLAPGRTRVGGRGIECLQVRLSPLVAHAILGSAPELSGSVVPFEAAWGRDAGILQERLYDACSWHERFAIVRDAIVRRRGEAHMNAELAWAWDRIALTRGQVRVETLAEELGWSRKRLWARFGDQIGCTPKRACQLVRFDAAAHRLAAGHGPARVAADCGYVDQSHLHREVMGFADMTPTSLASAAWLAVDDSAWPARPPDQVGVRS